MQEWLVINFGSCDKHGGVDGDSLVKRTYEIQFQ